MVLELGRPESEPSYELCDLGQATCLVLSFFICELGIMILTMWLHAVLRLLGMETDSLDVTAASLLPLLVTGHLPVMPHTWEGVALPLNIQMGPKESAGLPEGDQTTTWHCFSRSSFPKGVWMDRNGR